MENGKAAVKQKAFICVHNIILNTMATTISVRLGKAILSDLSKVEQEWQADRSEAVRRLLSSSIKEWKIENALTKLSQHKISIGKAAEGCGITMWEMLDLVKERNVDWTGYSDDDLKSDLKMLQ